MRLEHVQPPEDGTLVVRGSAPDEAAGLLVDDEFERLGVPAIALVRLKSRVDQ